MISEDQAGNSLSFLSANRAPGKRQIRVVNREELTTSLEGLMRGLGDDDEDDDDFREDNESGASDGDTNSDSSEDSGDSSSSENNAADNTTSKTVDTRLVDDEDVQESSNSVGEAQPCYAHIPHERQQYFEELLDTPSATEPVCCLCLNYNAGEVIQCDSCGLTVHEGCYGIGDDYSEYSEGSSETTEPWFCEPCLAGVKSGDLHCELCPIKGGALKRTDYGGSWVHLLCALYVSGCTFGDLERLSPICLFDIGYNRFGSKACAGCQKQGNRLAARTGVCSKCDAGMCKVYFHVTCAQKAGLLATSSLNTSLGSGSEHTVADPYFLCCPAHSDRNAMQAKAKRCKLMEKQASSFRSRQLTPREQRVLARRRDKHASIVSSKRPAWMPTNEKWQRLLPTSQKFFQKMGQKAAMADGVSREEWESEFRVSFSADMVGKFVMPPAFSPDFVSYFAEREKLLPVIRNRVEELTKTNTFLRTIQGNLKSAFDQADHAKRRLGAVTKEEHHLIESFCTILKLLGCQSARLPMPLPPRSSSPINGVNNLFPKPSTPTESKNRSTTTATSKRRSDLDKSESGVSRSMKTGGDKNRADPSIDSVRIRRCAECDQSHDQHLMAHCDTCGKHYHLSCLDPPLTKLPKKTSLYGWECSKCCEACSDKSDGEADVNAPRQLRVTRKPVVRFTTEYADEASPKDSVNGVISAQPKRNAVMAKRKISVNAVTSPSPKKRKEDNVRHSAGAVEPSVESKLEANVNVPLKLEIAQNDEVNEDSVSPTATSNGISPSRRMSSADMDHRTMARDEGKAQIQANIEACVDAVLKRVISGGRRPAIAKFKLKLESVANVGLEDEKDEDETGSLENSLGRKENNSIRRASIEKEGRRHSTNQKRNEVQVIRVEDLD